MIKRRNSNTNREISAAILCTGGRQADRLCNRDSIGRQTGAGISSCAIDRENWLAHWTFLVFSENLERERSTLHRTGPMNMEMDLKKARGGNSKQQTKKKEKLKVLAVNGYCSTAEETQRNETS